MKWLHPITYLKNSLLFCGGLGVLLGIVFTYELISLHEAYEVMMAHGFVQADTNDSTASSVAKTTDYSSTNQMNGKRIKILCMVMTSLPKNGERAKAVNNTWGKRCDKLIFFTSRHAKHFNTVILPESIEDKRRNLWGKVKFGFTHAYSSYYEFDWFLKADDDTYMVMENLKLFLSGYNTLQAMIFGCMLTKNNGGEIRRKKDTSRNYMSGGAGYVLSREALKRFVDVALKEHKCNKGYTTWAEDMNMGGCLRSVNVTFMDTRDYFGRLRFFPLKPHFMGYTRPGIRRHDFWLYRSLYHRPNEGVECCAESAISFHYVPPSMDVFDFFLYHLSPNQHDYRAFSL